MLSLYHDVNDRLAIMANLGWQDWSQFGKDNIGLTGDRVNVTPRQTLTTTIPGMSRSALSTGLASRCCCQPASLMTVRCRTTIR